jgi:hypothetical protein
VVAGARDSPRSSAPTAPRARGPASSRRCPPSPLPGQARETPMRSGKRPTRRAGVRPRRRLNLNHRGTSSSMCHAIVSAPSRMPDTGSRALLEPSHRWQRRRSRRTPRSSSRGPRGRAPCAVRRAPRCAALHLDGPDFSPRVATTRHRRGAVVHAPASSQGARHRSDVGDIASDQLDLIARDSSSPALRMGQSADVEAVDEE